jgi:hypothetical protein
VFQSIDLTALRSAHTPSGVHYPERSFERLDEEEASCVKALR